MITEYEYKKALAVVAEYEKQLADPTFIKVGDRVLIDGEYEDVVIKIEKNYKSGLDYLHFHEGWASRDLCKKINS